MTTNETIYIITGKNMGETFEVTSFLEYRRKIVEAGFTPVLVYFYAKWAGPCQVINETVQNAVDNNDIRLVKVRLCLYEI